MKDSAQHAIDVGIDCGGVSLVGEGGDCAGRVGSDPGEGSEGVDTLGKCAGMVMYNVPGEAMQIFGATVVAQPVPGLPHVPRSGTGEGVEGGEAIEEWLPVSFDTGDRCLLEHEFGDQDAVGVASPAPGKIAPMRSKPFEETPFESTSLARRIEANHGFHARQDRGAMRSGRGTTPR